MSALLDQFLREFTWREHHERAINAPPDIVFAATRALTARDVRLLGPLMALRRLPSLGRAAPTPSPARSFIDSAIAGGFVLLADDPPREIVLGAIGRFWTPRASIPRPPKAGPETFAAFNEPGYAKAVMNFRLHEQAGRTILETETRIAATDPASARAFGRYWTLIGPFSALIRLSMLAAVDRISTENRPPG